MKTFISIVVVVVIAASVLSFVFYGFDKYRAKKGGRRIPERTLHILALCGGWPGALAGQKTFRHKTQKTSFRIVFWACVFANVSAIAVVFWQLQNRSQ